MDTDDKVKEFLKDDTTNERREVIIEDFLKTDVSTKITCWNKYFGIENKDRIKFWEKLNTLKKEPKDNFLKSVSYLTNNEKMDLYSKTPEKFRDVLANEMIPKLATKPAKKSLISVIAIYLVFFMVINLIFLLSIVTSDIPKAENIVIVNMTSQVALNPSNHTVTYNFGILDGKSFDIDTHFIFLVFLAGSLGALIHGLAKLSQNARDGLVKQRDALWYLSRPFLGAALAIAVYMVFRGGLLTTSNIEILNPYGIAALSIITGLSTKQVTQKLKDLLESVFPTKNTDASKETE